MSLSNSYLVYLDQNLKLLDRTFYQDVLAWSQRSDQVSIEKEDKIKNIPKLVITSEESLTHPSLEVDDILVELSQSNLNLFDVLSEHSLKFQVRGYEEFLNLWPMFQSYFDSMITQSEQKLLERVRKRGHALFKEGNTLSLTNKDEDFLIDLIEELNPKGPLTYIQSKVDQYYPNELVIYQYSYALEEINSEKLYSICSIGPHTLYVMFLKEKANARLYTLLVYYCTYLDHLGMKIFEYTRTQKLKNELIIPIVVVGEKFQILSYNSRFTELNLTSYDLSEVQHNDQRAILGKNYRVIIEHEKNDKRKVLFFPVDEDLTLSQNPKGQELGIISSSLAHELNNPLAGILAAIDVIRLDFVNEEQEFLDEMRLGAERCRDLVQTFLGFSRVNSSNYKNLQVGLSTIIEQSLRLIRFRLVESNISVTPEFEKHDDFVMTGNPYVLSMIFYLIWSEMVTAFSHLQLLREVNGPAQLALKVHEFRNQIKIFLKDEIDLSQEVQHSKLLTHLMELANVRIQVELGELRLKEL